jgi:hypothetical protein
MQLHPVLLVSTAERHNTAHRSSAMQHHTSLQMPDALRTLVLAAPAERFPIALFATVENATRVIAAVALAPLEGRPAAALLPLIGANALELVATVATYDELHDAWHFAVAPMHPVSHLLKVCDAAVGASKHAVVQDMADDAMLAAGTPPEGVTCTVTGAATIWTAPVTVAPEQEDLAPTAPAPLSTSTECAAVSIGQGAEAVKVGAVLLAAAVTHRAQREWGDCAFDVFWPAALPHPVSAPAGPDGCRAAAHRALLLDNFPQLRPHNAVAALRPPAAAAASLPDALRNASVVRSPWSDRLVSHVHAQLSLQRPRDISGASAACVRGAYDYYHYRLDGFDDCGWGCAYRALQTCLSWFQRNGPFVAPFAVPDVAGIQRILARVDPEKAAMAGFVGSRTWIGSYEVMLVLQHFVPALECTLQRLETGAELDSNPAVQRLLLAHFAGGGGPVMIGGASYAHSIVGIDVNVRSGAAQYLILDPHYAAERTDLKVVAARGWCGWKVAADFFDQNQWYNICVPRIAGVNWC